MKKLLIHFWALAVLSVIGFSAFAAVAPTITTFTPTSGAIGTVVTVTGTGFTKTGNLTIGGVKPVIITQTAKKIVALVMPGAVTGKVVFDDKAGNATSSGNFTATATQQPGTQQGTYLASNSTAINSESNASICTAISANGLTAVVGIASANNDLGAAYIYNRSGNTWAKQGSGLPGSGATANSQQGSSVAISADGNTVIVGGSGDNGGIGAAWVFTRSGTTWTQQGSKLVGANAQGLSQQGYAVAISADGNNILVGGPGDNSQTGAAWAYSRTNGVWNQLGVKLVGTGVVEPAGYTYGAQQGSSVAISADGFTALVGGPEDNYTIPIIQIVVQQGTGTQTQTTNQTEGGAVWVYSRTAKTNWQQQGAKLAITANPDVTNLGLGLAVSLSANGNTALLGASNAAYVFTRSGTTWAQQSSSLNGGTGVCLTADGNTAVTGGAADSLWIYTRTGSTWAQQGNGIVAALGASRSLSQSFGYCGLSISGDGSYGMFTALANYPYTTAYVIPFSAQGLLAEPSISSISSTSGAVGTLITIQGTNLYPASGIYVGNGYPNLILSNTPTTAQFMVMPTSVTGTISLTTAAGTATATGNFTVTATPVPQVQQGSKLVGTGSSTVDVEQGTSVAISADGNTAVVGAPWDNLGTGAIWVYVRTGTSWAQQGNKLVGTGIIGQANFGQSVAISANGNIIAVGGPGQASGSGGGWIFVRTGTTWEPTGNEVLFSNADTSARFGSSVAMSADGLTIAFGMPGENQGTGAVYIASGNGFNEWYLLSGELTGTGNAGASSQGNSVAVSADGNTLLVGGKNDNSGIGAAWVFARNGNTWSQYGSKLVGTGNVGASNQGASVAISADGKNALIGGPADNGNTGAVWFYTKIQHTIFSAVWTQEGSKIIGTGAVAKAQQGSSVALSADAGTAVEGGLSDDLIIGATWAFTRSGAVFTQQGTKMIGGSALNASQGASVALSADGTTSIEGGFTDERNIGAAWIFVPFVVFTEDGKTDGNSEAVVQPDLSLPYAVSAYPNPFTGLLHLKIQSSSNDDMNLKVYSITGQLVEERTALIYSGDITVGSNYAPGIYIVQVKQGENSQQIKVVKSE